MRQEIVSFYLDSWSINQYGKWPIQTKPFNDHTFRIFSLRTACMFLSLLFPENRWSYFILLKMVNMSQFSSILSFYIALWWAADVHYFTFHIQVFRISSFLPQLRWTLYNLNNRQHSHRTIFNFCSLAPWHNIQWIYDDEMFRWKHATNISHWL